MPKIKNTLIQQKNLRMRIAPFSDSISAKVKDYAVSPLARSYW